MEYLVEGVLNLLMEGSFEIIKNKKISKWVRYPILILLISFFLLVIFFLGYFGIKLIISNKGISLYAGILFIIIDLLIFYYIVKKLIKEVK